jgi:hypothetical protein
MRRFYWSQVHAPSEPPTGGSTPPAVTPPTPSGPPQVVYVQAPAAHRVSGALIIGIVVVVMALGGGTAAGLAVFRHPGVQPSPTLPTPAPPVSPQANEPTPVPQASPVAQDSPSPAQPSPAASGGSSGGGSTIDTGSVSIDMPAGWTRGTVDSSSITIIEPNKGLLFVASGKVSGVSTNEAWVQHLVDAASKSNASASLCQVSGQPNPAPAKMVGLPQPPNGEYAYLCEVNNKGGKFVDLYYFSLLQDQSGNTYLFEANAYAPQDGFDAFLQDVNTAIGSVKWKLLKAS